MDKQKCKASVLVDSECKFFEDNGVGVEQRGRATVQSKGLSVDPDNPEDYSQKQSSLQANNRYLSATS